jgi:hypothetical protein
MSAHLLRNMRLHADLTWDTVARISVRVNGEPPGWFYCGQYRSLPRSRLQGQGQDRPLFFSSFFFPLPPTRLWQPTMLVALRVSDCHMGATLPMVPPCCDHALAYNLYVLRTYTCNRHTHTRPRTLSHIHPCKQTDTHTHTHQSTHAHTHTHTHSHSLTHSLCPAERAEWSTGSNVAASPSLVVSLLGTGTLVPFVTRATSRPAWPRRFPRASVRGLLVPRSIVDSLGTAPTSLGTPATPPGH